MSAGSGKFAPIAVFAYDRSDHLRQCIEALLSNDQASESDLYIFSDAAKAPERSQNVFRVREYIRSIHGFKTITIIEQPRNLGLAASVIAGVTKLTDEFGKVIVVEDDLVVSPYFLQFMNDGLDLYTEDERVAAIHGYMFPVKRTLPETFFLKDPGCWGWATWKRAWRHFEADGGKLQREIKKRGLTWAFDYDGQYDYSGMLSDQIAGLNSSWAVRWYASVFLAGGMVLHPGVSLVKNIGQDGSGTHDAATDTFRVRLSSSPIAINHSPVEENSFVRAAVIAYLKSIRQPFSSSFGRPTISRLWRDMSHRLFGS